MRIISGKKRGLRLSAVGKGDSAAHLRPTTDRVRESIFNVLMGGAYGDPIKNARVLDLFAGTGALGLEAWSRGAAFVTFVDDGTKAQTLIKRNIEHCVAQGETQLYRRDVLRLGPCKTSSYDLVFLDPPYGKGMGAKALVSALAGGWINDSALILAEDNQTISAPGFAQLDQRRYGDTYVTILEPESQP